MNRHNRLNPESAGLLVIDVQGKLFPHIERACEVMESIQLMVKGVKLLNLPIVVSEQYPKGLDKTIKPLRDLIGDEAAYPEKTCFSVVDSKACLQALEQTGRKQWIVVGIEAHVCVLQSVHGLLEKGYDVVVVNDAISSRSIYDFSTAIAEMRDMGARITSTETVLFELFKDSAHPQFKALSALLK